MASNTSTQINSSDPAVAIQVQRENAALQSQRQTALSSAPLVNGSSNVTTTTASRAGRSVAPVVSGSEVLYPQSTTTTSSNAVTINSSVNNDIGDVTTVYSTGGAITVNPINQTINQYTSVDSGVSQIVAGDGVTIASTGGSGTGVVTINATGGGNGDYGNSNVAAYLPTFTGNVGAGNVNVTGTVYANGLSSTGLASLTILNVSTTANLGAVGNITITGGSNGQVLTTNGNGVLSWSTAATGSYGNSNVVSLLSAFGSNTITTTGNVSVGNIIGNGQALTNIAGANVSGQVGNALVAGTVYTAAQPNITSVGTLSNLNVSGNSVISGNLTVGGNLVYVNVTTLSVVDPIIDLQTGPNGAAPVANSGKDVGTALNYYDTQARVAFMGWDVSNAEFGLASQASISSEVVTFSTYGNLRVGNIIGNGQALTSIAGANVSGFVPNANVANTAFSVAAANVSGLGNIATINLTGSNANVLYGNGVFAAVAGGGNSSELVNGNNSFVLDVDGNVVFEGNVAGQAIDRGLVWDYGANANGVNSMVRQDGSGLTVRAWTEDSGNFAASVNIVTNQDANAMFWEFDGNGNLTIPGSIIGTTTIEIDNRASGNGADINLYSADDILIQARDRDAGSTSEGGDINIFAGDSAEDSDTSAGDIVIEAGRGGASNLDFGGDGGFVRIEAGAGGNAVGANISARNGGSLTLNAGNAGTNNGNIDLGNSGGTVTINAGDSTGNGDPGGDIILNTGLAGANALAGQVQLIVPSSDEGNGGTWTFNGSGIIQLPNNGTIGNDGNNIDIGSTSAISLEAASAVNIYTDTGTAAWQWQFQDDGNLRLPTIELDVGNTINEQTVIQSQRKIIPGLRYSAEINGTTPTVVYTATNIDTTSMKVAMQIQHTGLGFEFFDVSATSTGGNTYYTVSNRVQPPTIDNSTVIVDLNGSNIMEITVTINSGAANSWVTYDATEFGIAVD